MKTYISLLRGINVSGKNKIKMVNLRAMYTSLGFTDVVSYIQSGNVLFKYKETPVERLATQVKEGILTTFGYEIKVLVLTKEAFVEAATNHLLVKTGEEELKQLAVTFLANKPDPELAKELASFKYKEDQFLLTEKLIYLYCPGGYGNTKLSNNFFERKLKVGATTRNWRSVNKLLELANELA